jgi:hypothetical protein
MDQTKAADEPLFKALLTPHRSLGRTGFYIDARHRRPAPAKPKCGSVRNSTALVQRAVERRSAAARVTLIGMRRPTP